MHQLVRPISWPLTSPDFWSGAVSAADGCAPDSRRLVAHARMTPRATETHGLGCRMATTTGSICPGVGVYCCDPHGADLYPLGADVQGVPVELGPGRGAA